MEVVLWGERERDWEICHDYQEAVQFIMEQQKLGVNILPAKIIGANSMTTVE